MYHLNKKLLLLNATGVVIRSKQLANSLQIATLRP
jgi:hypothetical protein